MSAFVMSAADHTTGSGSHRAHHHRDHPEHAVDDDRPGAEEILARLLAVVGPAEDRREDEGQEPDREDDRPDHGQVAERRRR